MQGLSHSQAIKLFKEVDLKINRTKSYCYATNQNVKYQIQILVCFGYTLHWNMFGLSRILILDAISPEF